MACAAKVTHAVTCCYKPACGVYTYSYGIRHSLCYLPFVRWGPWWDPAAYLTRAPTGPYTQGNNNGQQQKHRPQHRLQHRPQHRRQGRKAHRNGRGAGTRYRGAVPSQGPHRNHGGRGGRHLRRFLPVAGAGRHGCCGRRYRGATLPTAVVGGPSRRAGHRGGGQHGSQLVGPQRLPTTLHRVHQPTRCRCGAASQPWRAGQRIPQWAAGLRYCHRRAGRGGGGTSGTNCAGAHCAVAQ